MTYASAGIVGPVQLDNSSLDDQVSPDVPHEPSFSPPDELVEPIPPPAPPDKGTENSPRPPSPVEVESFSTRTSRQRSRPKWQLSGEWDMST